jgi:hypothetical protein
MEMKLRRQRRTENIEEGEEHSRPDAASCSNSHYVFTIPQAFQAMLERLPRPGKPFSP